MPRNKTLAQYFEANPNTTWAQLAAEAHRIYAMPGMKLVHVGLQLRLSNSAINRLLAWRAA